MAKVSITFKPGRTDKITVHKIIARAGITNPNLSQNRGLSVHDVEITASASTATGEQSTSSRTLRVIEYYSNNDLSQRTTPISSTEKARAQLPKEQRKALESLEKAVRDFVSNRACILASDNPPIIADMHDKLAKHKNNYKNFCTAADSFFYHFDGNTYCEDAESAPIWSQFDENAPRLTVDKLNWKFNEVQAAYNHAKKSKDALLDLNAKLGKNISSKPLNDVISSCDKIINDFSNSSEYAEEANKILLATLDIRDNFAERVKMAQGKAAVIYSEVNESAQKVQSKFHDVNSLKLSRSETIAASSVTKNTGAPAHGLA